MPANSHGQTGQFSQPEAQTTQQTCNGWGPTCFNNFIQSQACLCAPRYYLHMRGYKGLQRQNTQILSSRAFQVILGFNVLIHLVLLILTQWKFISWKLKSDLRGKIQISFQNPADMACHQGYTTQYSLLSFTYLQQGRWYINKESVLMS